MVGEGNSYILLIPWVSGYLAWLQRGREWSKNPDWSFVGFGLFSGCIIIGSSLFEGTSLGERDALAWKVSAFPCFLFAMCAWFLGREGVRVFGFPIGFLFLLAPLPASVGVWIQHALQEGSAAVTHVLFKLAGTPVHRDGLGFTLPGFHLEVAPECSGLHSTLILFITSLIAGYLFLQTPWKRLVLVLAVVPLGIFRNAVRIFVVGELCVHVGPDMIDSPIHRHGGPFFFALSLVALFLLILLLRASGRPRGKPSEQIPEV